MPTRNVVLTERQEALTEALARIGHCQNASEVLRDRSKLIRQDCRADWRRSERRCSGTIPHSRNTFSSGEQYVNIAAGPFQWVDASSKWKHRFGGRS